MKKYLTIHENKNEIEKYWIENNQPTWTDIFNNIENYILTLDRYENSFGSGYGDCWGEMVESEEGDWVKLEDVLKLFSAQKK